MQIGLAQNAGASCSQPRDRGGVGGGPEIPQSRRAGGGGQIAGIDAILDRDRQAVQRAQRPSGGAKPIGGPRRFAHAVGLQGDEGVQILAGGALGQQGLCIGFGGNLARAHGGDCLGGGKLDHHGLDHRKVQATARE